MIQVTLFLYNTKNIKIKIKLNKNYIYSNIIIIFSNFKNL